MFGGWNTDLIDETDFHGFLLGVSFALIKTLFPLACHSDEGGHERQRTGEAIFAYDHYDE